MSSTGALKTRSTPKSYRQKSWTISDGFWSKVEHLLPDRSRDPKKQYKRAQGAGRPPMEKRKVLAAIFYVARTGIQWKALPKSEFGSPSAIHEYFMQWCRLGVFEQIWAAGLAEYIELEGIAWLWQSVDGTMNKSPLARESAGPNPTDRGKNGDKTLHSCGRSWRPAFRRRVRGEH